MEQLDGEKSNQKLYVDYNQYLYTVNREKNHIKYLICRWGNEGCTARMIWLAGGKLTLTKLHDHEANILEVEVARYKTYLRKRARTENTSMQTIFTDAQQLFRRAALTVGNFNSVKNLMYNSRKLGTPPVPQNLFQTDQLISDQRWMNRYAVELGPAKRQFYKGCFTASDGSNLLIFISPTVISHVRRGNEVSLHMDGTFKVVPGGAMQLFMVHQYYRGTVFPLAYALMERKTVAAYEKVLQVLFSDEAPNLRVTGVIADYEAALRIAVRNQLPDAALFGCWFHYCRAVYKKVRDLRLDRLAAEERGQPEENRIIGTAIRMSMALPLLPPHLIRDGITCIENHCIPLMGVTVNFINYLKRNWLPCNISVYNREQRTNNAVESFHRCLNKIVGRAHPNMWTLIEYILQIENTKACDLQRLEDGVDLPAQRRRVYVRLDRRIRNAQIALETEGDVRHFLRHLGHTTARLQRQFAPLLNDADNVNADPPIPNAVHFPDIPLPANDVQENAPVIPEEEIVLDHPVVDVGEQRTPENRQATAAENATGETFEGFVANYFPNVNDDSSDESADEDLPPRELRCVVCLGNRRTHMFIDCRHFCICSQCSERFEIARDNQFDDEYVRASPPLNDKCPQCRTVITQPPVVVLDEADRCLDMGFEQTMNAIIANLPLKRQTLLFSATQTKSVKDLARLSLKDPCYVSVHENSQYSTPAGLEQSYVVCELHDKISIIWSFIKNHLKQKCIIFFSSCKEVKYIFEIFCKLRPGMSIMALYGTLHQLRRMSIYKEFCQKSAAVLFATDLAARGLDFPKVHWVVQADCPEDTDTYIHRVGRTARYHSGGESLLLLLPSEETMVEKLQQRKIPINKIEINPSKLQNPVRKMEAFLARDPALKDSAQRAFVSYIKSIFLMKDKSVFDVNAVETDSFANSLGLAIPPRIRFLQRLNAKKVHKPQKLSNKKYFASDSDSEVENKRAEGNLDYEKTEFNDSGVSEDEHVQKPENTSNLFHISDDSDSDEGILKVKRKDHDIELPSKEEVEQLNLHKSLKKKALSKVAMAKKILRKKIAPNKKIIFNDDGESIKLGTKEKRSELAQEYENENEGGIDIEKAKMVLKEEDKFDKQLFKEKVKLKHREEKLKMKQKRKSENQQEKDDFGSDSEGQEPDLSWLPDPDKIYGRKRESADDDGDDNENNSNESTTSNQNYIDNYIELEPKSKPLRQKYKRKLVNKEEKNSTKTTKKKKPNIAEASALSVNEAEELAMMLLKSKH